MTRKKKARRVGSEGPAQYTEKKLSKQDIAAIARKKQAKKKGQAAGSRHSQGKTSKMIQTGQEQDPRLGSKKPIPLVVEQVPHPKSNQAKKVRKLNAAQELEQLENDAQLNALLDRLDNGERLGSGLQSYVDEKLDRIELLMKQLGLLEPETDKSVKTKINKDDELLARFENTRFDEE